MDEWQAAGVVQPWGRTGRVGRLSGVGPDHTFTPLDKVAPYIGSNDLGMGSVTTAMARSLVTAGSPRTDVWWV